MLSAAIWRVEGWGRERTSEVGVVDLNISETVVIQNLELRAVCSSDVCEILGVGCIHILGIRLSCLVAQMVPVGGRKSKLGLVLFLLGEKVLQVVPLVHVCASNMLDFSSADDCLCWLVLTFKEACNVRGVPSSLSARIYLWVVL